MMPNFNEMLLKEPFGMPQQEKEKWFTIIQKELTHFHYENCVPYKDIIDRITALPTDDTSICEIPFLPVRLFKLIDLKSTNDSQISRVLTSSGTSGTKTSKIHLNRKAILLQSRVLKHIFSDIFPKSSDTTMFVVERPENLHFGENVSASVAAIRGFSQFAKSVEAILNDEGDVNIRKLEKYIHSFPEKPFVIFGFTAPIWFQLIEALKQKNITLASNKGILVHGGGWKKMQDQAVDRNEFNQQVKSVLGISSVHNYYGMVEQTGSVFIECNKGFFHPSIFSEVIIRDGELKPAKPGIPGLIQVMTLLAESYPGHSLLTDDVGTIEGYDYCSCGKRGKFFSVTGRAPGVEMRGCSDAK